MVGAVDFTDAKRWLAFGTRNTHLALVIHAVGRVRLELVREDLAVTCDRSNGIETSDVPESAVLLVPGDRTPEAEVRVHRPLVATELVGMVIEFDDRIGVDVRTAHYAIFASLARLSHCGREEHQRRWTTEQQRPSAVGRSQSCPISRECAENVSSGYSSNSMHRVSTAWSCSGPVLSRMRPVRLRPPRMVIARLCFVLWRLW